MKKLNRMKRQKEPVQLKIAALQLDLTVGGLTENARAHWEGYQQAVQDGAELVLGPELGICGYPPKDNLLRWAFVLASVAAVKELATRVGDVPLVIGTPWPLTKVGPQGQKATNSYVVLRNGKIVFRTDKRIPAQGGVFDEQRVHVPGKSRIYRYKGLRIGFPICEDIWHDQVVDSLVKRGVDLLLVPNGSPTYVGKLEVRHKLVRRHVRRTGVPMLYLNQVGGQDEHAFDGGAFYVNPGARKAKLFLPYWQQGVGMVTFTKGVGFRVPRGVKPVAEPMEMDFLLDAVMTVTKGYFLKSSSLRKVVIGVSGGVDSALVLAIAVMLFGAENVIAVSMPSKHNSGTTKGFAQQICDNLGVDLRWMSIQEAKDLLTMMFEKEFKDLLKVPGNAADENTQSRIRGLLLMMIANRYNAMVLSTGNKSEMAVGYATLYGDMNGGFNPLKTVYKMQCYRLGHAINARLGSEVIPNELIHQKPSAELDDGQFDENSLPPYPLLDAILWRFLEEEKDVADIVGGKDYVYREEGIRISFPRASEVDWGPVLEKKPMQRWLMTEEVGGMVRYRVHPDCVAAIVTQDLRMRFKRYQAPPGATVNASFDAGEDFPVANKTADWLTFGLRH